MSGATGREAALCAIVRPGLKVTPGIFNAPTAGYGRRSSGPAVGPCPQPDRPGRLERRAPWRLIP
jgi:hypothetical protein